MMKFLAWMDRDDQGTNPWWVIAFTLYMTAGTTISLVKDLLPALDGVRYGELVFFAGCVIMFATNLLLARVLKRADFFKMLFVLATGYSVAAIPNLAVVAPADEKWQIFLLLGLPAILLFVILAVPSGMDTNQRSGDTTNGKTARS